MDNRDWYLLNASPDLRAQIESTPELQPKGRRHTPITGVVLTSGDLDQVLGLLLLRESQSFRIYSTASIRGLLTQDNSMFRVLERLPQQVFWTDIRPGEKFEFRSARDEMSGLQCEPVALPGRYSDYANQERVANSAPEEAVLGLFVNCNSGGRRLFYAPGLAQIEDSLLRDLEACDLVLLDGTFWSNDELIQIRGCGPTAREMGHLPIGGSEGSLERIRRLKRPRKIYIHVNNTNPILDEESPEFQQLCDTGCEVARDGWEFEL